MSEHIDLAVLGRTAGFCYGTLALECSIGQKQYVQSFHSPNCMKST